MLKMMIFFLSVRVDNVIGSRVDVLYFLLKRVMMISPDRVRDAIDIYQHLFSHRISFILRRTEFSFRAHSRNSFFSTDDTVYNFQLTMTSEIEVEHAREHSKELFGNEKK